MRLTPRGWAVVAVAGLATVFAFAFGQQALNAVAAPLMGALVYGAVSLYRGEAPTADAAAVRAGYPDETRRLSLSISGGGVSYVQYRPPAGLEGEAVDRIVSLPTTVETEVRLASRGVYALGDLSTWRRDPLGLLEAAAELHLDAAVVVYPTVYRSVGPAVRSPLLDDEHRVERQAFDALREYRPGDPLRQIHWKSSAKHGDFLVTEFASDRRTETLTVAADAVPGAADEMATAAGTVALAARRAGLDVGLALPGTSVPAGSGEAHRANLLGVLARVDAGDLPAAVHADADVSIRADRSGTTVELGGRRLALHDVVPEVDARQSQEVAGA